MKGQPLLVLGLILCSWTVMRVNLALPSDQKIIHPNHIAVSLRKALRSEPENSAPNTTERRKFEAFASQPENPAPLAKITRLSQRPVTLAVRANIVPFTPKAFAEEGSVSTLIAAISPPSAAPKPAKEPKSLRFSGSFWLLVRGGAATNLTSPSLGASQVGGRALLPIATVGQRTRLSASFRTSAALRGRGEEIGLGFSFKTNGALPVEMIAERRFALSKGERDRWSLLVASGFDDVKLTHRISVDGYGQAGVVGMKDRETFAGGSLSVRHDLMTRSHLKASLGLGLWGDAQKGASRVDFGPELVAKARLGQQPIRVSAQWRFRLSGKAIPDSGPALAIAGDF